MDATVDAASASLAASGSQHARFSRAQWLQKAVVALEGETVLASGRADQAAFPQYQINTPQAASKPIGKTVAQQQQVAVITHSNSTKANQSLSSHLLVS